MLNQAGSATPRIIEQWAVSGQTWPFLCCPIREQRPIIFFAYFAVFFSFSLAIAGDPCCPKKDRKKFFSGLDFRHIAAF